MGTLEKEYQVHHAKIEAVMKEDAKLNGIPVSRLNPADYGLGVDPKDSKIYQNVKKQEVLCDNMRAAAKDVETTFSAHCDVSMRPRGSMSLVEVSTQHAGNIQN